MKLLHAFAALALLASPAIAQAQDVPNVHVGYGDLDLAAEAGARTLRQRVSQAIATVCPRVPRETLTEYMARLTCRRDARAVSDPQVQAALARARGRAEALAAR